MKYLVVLLCLALSGCVATVVKVTPEPLEIKVYRFAVLYKADIPVINKDGIQGYSGEYDAKAISAIAERAVKAASLALTKGASGVVP